MNSILVATDFSAASDNAVFYAAGLARQLKTTLTLLHISEPVIAYGDVPVVVPADEMMAGATNSLNQLKQELLAANNDILDIKTECLSGSFFVELEEVCTKIKPLAVVMGSQGKTAAEAIFFGSNTVYAMKHLNWPVLAVPAGARFSPIRTIGLACDLKEVRHTVPVRAIQALVNQLDAQFHVLNAGSKESYDPEAVFGSVELEELMRSISPRFHFVESNDPDTGIFKFAKELAIDLLLILPKEHHFFDRLFHKSHTKAFVQNSPVPVMAIHQ